jgi:transcriptional regulator
MPRSPARRAQNELLPGTLEMLILRTLAIDSMHGYAIAQHIGKTSQDVLRVEKGSLYPALERLLRNGWATAKWGTSTTGRRARYYSITASGRRALGDEISAFESICAAITRVLNPV